MPELGEMAYARDIGRLGSGAHKCIWAACLDCGKERWVFMRGGVPSRDRCHPCGSAHRGRTAAWPTGADHWAWKGGRSTRGGYVEYKINPAHPFHAMSGRGNYVYEHRLVMAEHLGRCLLTGEQVHHLNGDKADNRIENLELVTRSEHAARHHEEIKTLRARVRALEAELASLKRQSHDCQTETA